VKATVGLCEARLNEGLRWCKRLAEMISPAPPSEEDRWSSKPARRPSMMRSDEMRSKNLAAGMDVSEIRSVCSEALHDLSDGGPLYVYPLDEVTGEPARGKGAPLMVNSYEGATLVPLLVASLRAAALCGGVAGVGRMYGCGTRRGDQQLPHGWGGQAQGALEVLKQSSLAIDRFGLAGTPPGVSHDEIDHSAPPRSARAAALRELEKLYGAQDREKGHGGLSQLGSDETLAAWTSVSDAQKVVAALERQARWRADESRLSEEYVRTVRDELFKFRSSGLEQKVAKATPLRSVRRARRGWGRPPRSRPREPR